MRPAWALRPSASSTSGARMRCASSRARRWVPCSRPMPEPRTTHAARSRCRENLLGGRWAQPPLAARAAHRHHLGQLDLEDRLEVARHRHRRVAGAAPDRRQRRQADGAGQPAGAADDHHLARGELRRPGRTVRHELQHTADRSARRSPRPARPSGIPIGATRSSPVWSLPGAIQWPNLGAWKVTVMSACDGRALDLAGGGVHAGRDVRRHHRGASRVDRVDRGARRVARGAREAGPEDRVDHDPAPRPAPQGARRHRRCVPPRSGRDSHAASSESCSPGPSSSSVHLETQLSEGTRRHQAVASVVALAADDGDPAGAGGFSGSLRDRPAGGLHQLAGTAPPGPGSPSDRSRASGPRRGTDRSSPPSA